MTVPARVSLVTLGVRDVRASTAFYQALGWPLSPASVEGDVSFFNTAGGLLALWGRDDLAADTRQSPAAEGFRSTALAMNLDSREQVDAALTNAANAGGTIVRPAEATEWGGYNGYFADPDGHLWEVAHNPDWPIGDDERPQLPRG